MIILGVNRGDHDASACIVEDGKLVSFINVERLTRVKRDADRVWEAVRYCLEAAELNRSDVDLVVQNSYRVDLDRYDRLSPTRGVPVDARDYLDQFPRVLTISHHLAHAYSALALAPFDDCAIMVVDGIGQTLSIQESEAETGYHYRHGQLECIYIRTGTTKTDGIGFHNFDSLGAIYSAISSYVFGHWNECGKVMGLAPHADGELPPWNIVREVDGKLTIDLDFLNDLRHPNISPNAWRIHNDEYKRVSLAIQNELEWGYLWLANQLYQRTTSPNLVVTGGVSLNCVANYRLVRETPFDNVFVPPATGDEGIAIGCAFYGWHKEGSGTKRFHFDHPYYGKCYTGAKVAEPLNAEPLIEYYHSPNIAVETAAMLAEGRIVGWFQGASEMGARALGNRSILADPRDRKMKDIINARVKHREAFRPFGGSVTLECAPEYFDADFELPYMTFAVPVRPEVRDRLGAIVHVDGTCRPQTVRREDNPKYHALISEFGRLTGLSVVLNTSFNIKGDPIVETPQDALDCLLATELDALIIHDFVVTKRSIWNGNALAPWVTTCGLRCKRELTLESLIQPTGHMRYRVSTASAPMHTVDIEPGHAPLFGYLDGKMPMADIVEAMKIAPASLELRNLMALILQLRGKGLLQLVKPPR